MKHGDNNCFIERAAVAFNKLCPLLMHAYDEGKNDYSKTQEIILLNINFYARKSYFRKRPYTYYLYLRNGLGADNAPDKWSQS